MKTPLSVIHADLGLAINKAKKKMYRAHRSGAPLVAAFDSFLEDVTETQQRYIAEHLGKHATEEQRNACSECHSIFSRHSRSEPREETGTDGGNSPAEIRKRAEALLANSELPAGRRYHVEDFLREEKWDALAVIVDSIEHGRNYDEILIAHDERTLQENELEAVCKEIADALEGDHLVGYLCALFEHIEAASRNQIDAGNVVFEVKRYLITHNATGQSEAVAFLTSTALANLRIKLSGGVK